MRKIVFMLCFLYATSAYSQSSFNHSLGLSFYGYDGVPGIMYSPRFTLSKLNDNTNLSIGTHIGINYAIYSGGMNLLDVPIVMEMNFGHGSDSNNKKKKGGFIGLGYGYAENDDGNQQGLLMNVGFRRKVFDSSIGMRLSLLTDITFSYDYFSLGVFYTFF